MFGEEFKISREKYEKQKVKHQFYLAKKRFEILVPGELEHNPDVKKEIEDLGHWYLALESGKIKPITASQALFVNGIKNNSLSGQIGKNWINYRRQYHKWGNLYAILKKCSDNELEVLSRILKSKDISATGITEKMESASKNLAEVFGDTSYREILLRVQKKLKLNSPGLENQDIERKIVQHIFKATISKLSNEEKIQYENEIIEKAKKEGKDYLRPGAVFATLTAANLSGFSVYLLATSTLGTLTSLIGVTVPFAVYTSLTSSIAFLTGPAGWMGAGLYAVWKLNDVDYKKLIPAIVYIHWLRERYSQ